MKAIMTSALSCIICHDCNKMLRYFHVPSDPARLQEWTDLLNLDINPSSIVCEKHFLKEHIARNSELNCCRLNKKAIPTLYLTKEEIGSIKLIDEDNFDRSENITYNDKHQTDSKTKDTGTKKFQHTKAEFLINCLWCNDSFSNPDIYEILLHLKSEHYDEMVSFFESADDKFLPPKTTYLKMDDDSSYVKDDIIIVENSDYDEIDVETNSIDESTSIQNDSFEDNVIEANTSYESGSRHSERFDNEGDDSNDIDDETVTSFEVEEYNAEKEFLTNSSDEEEEGNIDGILNIQTNQSENYPINKMLPNGEISSNEVHMKTSDPKLIFYLIDLLQSIPTLWFFNGIMSKEYADGFMSLCAQFSEKYQYFMTQTELHESLMEIRDFYLKTCRERTFTQLSFPLSEYYQRLAEFLPDKPDGKTCVVCGVLFHDHLQYFAHLKLEHEMDDDDRATSALEYLRTNSHVYFYARYPLRQGGFSYQCQICQVHRKNKREFFEHIKKHLDIRDHVCDMCGKTFIKHELFLVHKNRHLGLHKFQCKICNKEFTNFSLLTAHRKRYHRPIEGTIEEIESFCKKRLYTAANNRPGPTAFHVFLAEDNSEIYGCLYCDKTYKFRSGIFKHRKTAHPDVEGIKAKYAKMAKNMVE